MNLSLSSIFAGAAKNTELCTLPYPTFNKCGENSVSKIGVTWTEKVVDKAARDFAQKHFDSLAPFLRKDSFYERDLTEFNDTLHQLSQKYRLNAYIQELSTIVFNTQFHLAVVRGITAPKAPEASPAA